MGRLTTAIDRLAAIKAITGKEQEELKQQVEAQEIRKVAEGLVRILKEYDDETRKKPDPRFPSLKRCTFRPKIYTILTEQHLACEVQAYIVEGFTKGFSTLWEGDDRGRRWASNPKLTPEGEQAVLTTILKDWKQGIITQVQMWGDDDFASNIVISPTYAVEKRSCGHPVPGKFRRVFNLSKRFEHKRNRKRTKANSIKIGRAHV